MTTVTRPTVAAPRPTPGTARLVPKRMTDRLAQLSNVHLDISALREAFTKPTPKRSADWAVLAERMRLHEPEALSDRTPEVNRVRKPPESKVWAGGLLNDTWHTHAPPSPKDWCWTECESELDYGHCGLDDWWTETLVKKASGEYPFSGPASPRLPWWGKDDEIKCTGALKDAHAWATETASKFPGERDDAVAYGLLAMTEALQDPSLTSEYDVKCRVVDRMGDEYPRGEEEFGYGVWSPTAFEASSINSSSKVRGAGRRDGSRHASSLSYRDIPIGPTVEYLTGEKPPTGDGWVAWRCFGEHADEKIKKTAGIDYNSNVVVCHHDECNLSGDAIHLLMQAEGLPYLEARELAIELAETTTNTYLLSIDNENENDAHTFREVHPGSLGNPEAIVNRASRRKLRDLLDDVTAIGDLGFHDTQAELIEILRTVQDDEYGLGRLNTTYQPIKGMRTKRLRSNTPKGYWALGTSSQAMALSKPKRAPKPFSPVSTRHKGPLR